MAVGELGYYGKWTDLSDIISSLFEQHIPNKQTNKQNQT